MIKLILADDHKLFREGVRSILESAKDIEIVDEVADGRALINSLRKHETDMIMLDISMPGISGIEACRIIRKEYPCLKILMLSMHGEESFVRSAIEAGANGYLPKEIDHSELIEAIHIIHQGGNYYSKDISYKLINSYLNKDKQQLTPREKEILVLVCDGLTNKEVADRLFISVRTVDCHKNNILQKLGLKSSVDLVKYALKNELISL
ncbi:MAG: response regulator transcription factor [Bacteroidetes bacterium]|nr:response regulator transcription factor [Bacteroidota bacterium]MBU1578994.1 response regulator transcription factor [Bacteroidota bacterium]MBU2466351.1 response regulator transcription factor [Bacteroidota bacterium]MBU2558652.1 response regulator transcription factor [Bacteroidota bacterium]